MQLQVAIDRVSLNTAIELAHELDGQVDIIEFGTSLVKDYGLKILKEVGIGLNSTQLLLDMKTNDEGAYEFERGFETQADILTVMGSSSLDTLKAVYEVTEKAGKSMLIDLLGLSDEQINGILGFENAIYGLHHSKDDKSGFDAIQTTADFHNHFPAVQHIAVAGGIDMEQAAGLAKQQIAETIIVGGKIVKTADPVAAAKQFMKEIH